jgi:prepilin-type processing-associated H-X9-DG protein
MSSIKLSAQKVKDVSNLQKIAEAWRECVINRGWRIDKGETAITRFTERLAGYDNPDGASISNLVLNDANIYISPGDKYASKVLCEALVRLDSYWGTAYTATFAGTSHFMHSIISYCLIANLLSTVPLDTTPLGFTRGLRVDGKWDEKAGLYGSKGGYVVYCDGHVVWFDGSRPAKFLKWDKSGYTSDIRYAVPSSAWITCGNQGTKTDYTSDGQLVLLYHQGAGGS